MVTLSGARCKVRLKARTKPLTEVMRHTSEFIEEVRVRPIRKKSWQDLWNLAAGAPKPVEPVDVDAAIQAAVKERFNR